MKLLVLILLATMTHSTLINPTASQKIVFDFKTEQAAMSILTAFQRRSTEDFVAHYPTLSAFHDLMKANQRLYGNHLGEAIDDFTTSYLLDQLPSLCDSFDRIIHEGTKKGINWEKVQYVGIETINNNIELKPTPLTIVFLAGGKRHRLTLEKAFLFRGEWRVCEELSLS